MGVEPQATRRQQPQAVEAPALLVLPHDTKAELLWTPAELHSAAECAYSHLVRAWSALHVGQVQDAYRRLDDAADLLSDLHRAADAQMEDQGRFAALVRAGQLPPPWRLNASIVPFLPPRAFHTAHLAMWLIGRANFPGVRLAPDVERGARQLSGEHRRVRGRRVG